MKKVENRLVNCAESYSISALGFVEHLSQTFWITALMNVRNFKRDKLVASLFSTVWGGFHLELWTCLPLLILTSLGPYK